LERSKRWEGSALKMSRGQSTFRERDLKRVLKTAKDVGVKIERIEIVPGKLVFYPANDDKPAAKATGQLSSWDDVT
jgi:hypothetical protein